ncbi:hypothetical protein [Croceicoccus sp. BE223]|uniref:hypothetical protein n=1 Tax=Croceicoccus sp. BE223 TaxID=2817716 RepID=UPI0028586D39|nr:hypothetical protein [Croceicoccus sp. BE223]MDR7102857.1 hypothetical protein [Croceicoccus sp. BE223]
MNDHFRADVFLPEHGKSEYDFHAARVHKVAIYLSMGSLTYASVRYNLIKGVPWSDWPMYTVNKAAALLGMLLIASALLSLLGRGPTTSGPYFRLAGWAITVHAILSLSLLDPAYFPAFFSGGKLVMSAGFALLLGAICTTTFVRAGRDASRWSTRTQQYVTGVIAIASGFHAALPGWTTWLEPGRWPGMMPPITMISFLIGVACLAMVPVRDYRSRRGQT